MSKHSWLIVRSAVFAVAASTVLNIPTALPAGAEHRIEIIVMNAEHAVTSQNR
jgi:hypothetical protein